VVCLNCLVESNSAISSIVGFLDKNFGLYLPSNSELLTTVTELMAIAPAARNGSHENIPAPRNGTNIPAAIGIKPVL
jgi:hypothetical protein